MSTALVLDCAVKNISLGLISKQKGLLGFIHKEPCEQSKELLQTFDELLKVVEVSLEDISTVVYSHGPGSFTSLRVGLSFLKGLFLQSSVEYRPVSSLFLRTLSVEDTKNIVVSVIKMGRGQFACGVWDHNDFSETIVQEADFLSWVQTLKSPITFCGEGVVSLPLDQLKDDHKILHDSPRITERALQNLLPLCQDTFSLFEAKPHYGIEPQIG